MNAAHSLAETGKWTDYTTGETWVVATAKWGYIIPAFVGVWLSLSAKNLKKILANFALLIHLSRNKLPLNRGPPTESTPLLDPPGSHPDAEPKKKAQVLAKVFKAGGEIDIARNGTTTYYYYYGEKPLHDPPVNYTYTTTGDPFDRLAPAYDVLWAMITSAVINSLLTKCSSAYTTNATNEVERYWKPIPELTHPAFSTLTLIFVSSLRILYKKRSDDPIFPADEEYFLPGDRKPWFRNSDPRARPLACINFIEVCLGDGKTCWPMNGHIPNDTSGNLVATPPDFWLMYASLLKTDIYNSIEKRLGRGLLAQRMVSQYFSEALGDDHWVDEVQSLVATSLARTQINAWSIASGEDSIHEGKDGYTLITTEEYGNLCGMFKFNPPGYASIRFVSSILILVIFPVVQFLSLKWSWITGTSKTTDAAVVGAEPAEAQGVNQHRPTSQPANPTAFRSEAEETATLGRDVAGPSALSSTNAPPESQNEALQRLDNFESADLAAAGPQSQGIRGLGQEQTSQRPLSPILRQGAETRGTTTANNASTEVEWEPLVIEIIVGVIITSHKWGPWLLHYIFVRWPKEGLETFRNWQQTRRRRRNA